MKCIHVALAAFCALGDWAPFVQAQTQSNMPPYFIEERVGGEWNEACGLTFDSAGRLYVWERAGRVWRVGSDGVRESPPLLDISGEVGGWRDFGMLGFALDPQFAVNGYVYVLYVVDRHHLLNYGTAAYNPATDQYFQATIGRLTRYTARSSDGFRTVDPASRRVLIGESISTGFPILYQSHGPGSLVFGADGTLLVSAGEGASYDGTDAGGTVGANYTAQGLADGIIRQKDDVGAYRAQLVDSLGGKILRIDPATGDGVPGNPFYDSAAVRSARSRVWALGLRNPYRMTMRPGTGSANRADAKPGVLYVGDVGWSGWEELNIVERPGMNFGWPVFEGMETQSEYDRVRAFNRDASNPLYGRNGCAQRYFSFHDLIVDDTLNPNPWFSNPCDAGQAIPATIPRFVHSRAALEWRNFARTGGYDPAGQATIIPLGTTGSPVAGTNFGGECSVAGVWYRGTDFPEAYRNTYFHADFETEWIRNLVFDENNRLLEVRPFAMGAGGVVAMATHPTQGGLYYVRWGMEVIKVSYSIGANQRPTAVLTASRSFGPSPLVIDFAGTDSFDPEGSPVSYQWDFGDGTAGSMSATVQHTFQASGLTPQKFTVTLTVTDTNGASASRALDISVNNTPPSVAIRSPSDGAKYSLDGDTVYQLRADVSDAEHTDAQLSYQWQTFLHHNEHEHSEPINTNRTPTTLISPVGCSGGETYHFRIALIVTDSAGLSATNEVNLFPDCENHVAHESFPTPWLQRDIGAVAVAGNASYSNHVFSVAGSGDDIWGNADEFRFAYWAQPGNGQISARVASQEETQPGAKAGVMIRETLDPGSRYAMAAVTPTGLLFQFRTAPGGVSAYQIVWDLAAPYWVRIARSGNTFTGHASPDGLNWTVMGSASVPMGNSAWGGLAVSSHNDGLLSTAVFESVVGTLGATVAANGPMPPPWKSMDIGFVGLAGGATQTNGIFYVTGTGQGIDGTADAFRFVYRSWTGDVEVITRLTAMQETAAWAKAGVMLRASLDLDAASAFVAFTPRLGTGWQTRSATGGATDYVRGPGLMAPAWLKLVRSGDQLTGSVSADGTSWLHIGTQTLALPAAAYVGFAVTSADRARLNPATFGNVTLRVPQMPVNVGVTEASWPIRRIIPRITWARIGARGEFTLRLEDYPGHRLQLQRATVLGQWQEVTVLENRDGLTFFADSVAPGDSARFYRVLVVP